MARSEKLANDIMALAQREAGLRDRSVVAGRLRATEFDEEEASVWLDGFASKMTEPSATETAFFAQRRMLGCGVGLDADGNLVYADKFVV